MAKIDILLRCLSPLKRHVGSNPTPSTKTFGLISQYCDPQDKKRCDNRGWFPSVDGGIRKDRSNLTGAGNATIFPGCGAGGGMRDG